MAQHAIYCLKSFYVVVKREALGTYLCHDRFEWSKLSAPSHPRLSPLAHLFSIFENDAEGGARLRAGGELTLELMHLFMYE